MSSVVTAPEGSTSRLSRTTPISRVRRGGLSGDFLLGLLGALVLGVVVFAARGGDALGGYGGDALSGNTWVRGGLVALAAVVVIWVLLSGAPGRLWGAGALVSVTALAALTYASIAWSVQPYNSWNEGNRTLSYLAAFAAALLLARVVPTRWRAMLGAVATAATVACAYSLLVKVFPATLDPRDPYGRLQAPFEYWNAVGLMAAIGIPACLWAGARREQTPLLRALAMPAIAVLVGALILAFSRGAILAAVVGVAIWFAFAPLRLRSALVLAVGSAGGAVIGGWGIAQRGISGDHVAQATRTNAGHGFGLVIVATLVVTLLAGIGAQIALDRVTLAPRTRRRIGIVLIGLVALIPVAGVAALAASHRGLTGQVSHLWSTLTSTSGGQTNQVGRLVQLSNSRPHYWQVALKIGEHHPLAGVGALGYATAQLRYGGDAAADYQSVHAHGYVMQTFADFGAIGLVVSLAALVTWALAAARTLELGGRNRRAARPAEPAAEPELTADPTRTAAPARDADPPRTAESAGLIAMVAIVVAFGVHSTIDWTWFIPGDAVIALACAGWVAGRGPLSQSVGRLPRRRVLTRSPGASGGMMLVVLISLAALWVIAQPLRSSDSYFAAIAEAQNHNGPAALTDARAAVTEDPVSLQALNLLSQLETAVHDPAAARQALSEAVSRQPDNPDSWQQLGCYDLDRHHQALATYELNRALALEPGLMWFRSNLGLFCVTVNG